MREIVRNIGANVTHLADIDSTMAAVAFGATYRRPPEGTVTLCKVRIRDGVVMRARTSVKCKTCRLLDEAQGADDGA